MRHLKITPMRHLKITPMTLVDGEWTKGKEVEIDVANGCSIIPHVCGKESDALDSGSEIKVFQVDPQKGIIGEDVYYSHESPSALRLQL